MVKDDIGMFSSTVILIQADKNAVLQVNSVSSAKKIRKEFKWYIERSEQLKLRHS